MSTRTDRLVENEEAFRKANERLVQAVEGTDGSSTIPFLCECADDTCLGRVELDLETYREVRSDSNRFFRLPGHPEAPGEVVLSSNDGYEIVEKESGS